MIFRYEGADVNTKNKEGHAALHLIVNKYYNNEMADFLRKHGVGWFEKTVKVE